MIDALNLVNHMSILKLLAAKKLLHRHKSKCDSKLSTQKGIVFSPNENLIAVVKVPVKDNYNSWSNNATLYSFKV